VGNEYFKINAIDYEENQHYFLGHYFLDKYDNALLNYPQINSRINITRLEVWVLDQGTAICLSEKYCRNQRFGEGAEETPDNSQNGLYCNFNGTGNQRCRNNYGIFYRAEHSRKYTALSATVNNLSLIKKQEG
jgi:cell surface protein SprA